MTHPAPTVTHPAPGWTVRRSGPLAWLVVDRPAKHNAVSLQMWRDLPGVLQPLAADPDLRVLLVEGEGATFCAGADIGDLVAGEQPDPMAPLRAANLAALAALRAFPRPTVAVVRGAAIGGGLEIATACDLRVADRSARFGVTPAKIGVVYHPPSIRALRDLVGPATAAYLLFSGRLLDAEQAHLRGLVDVLAADADAEAVALAQEMCARSALTQQAAKDVLRALSEGADPEAGIEERYLETIASGELPEGVAAFLERRAPAFPWRPHA